MAGTSEADELTEREDAEARERQARAGPHEPLRCGGAPPCVASRGIS